jgi:hypothetical protein
MSLLQLVNIREIDYVYDHGLHDTAAFASRNGEKNALANIDIWSQFLAPTPAALIDPPHVASSDVNVPPYKNLPLPPDS